MKVLHVIPSLSPVHGGPSAALPIMEDALRGRGICVESATTNDDGPGRKGLQPLGQAVHEGEAVRWYFDKTAEFYKISFSFRHWIKHHVRNYDLVHIHALFSYTSVVAAREALRSGVPYIVRPLGVLTRYGMTQRRALLKRMSFRFLEAKILRHAAAVHFTSREEQMEAETLGVPMRSKIVPLAIRMPDDVTTCRQKYLLFLSRLDSKKNPEGLLAAWAAIEGDFAEWQLLMGGSGTAEYELALQQLAEKLGVAKRVRWLSMVAGKEKSQLLHEAGAYVLPSFSENFGIAAAEALAYGVPCLLGRGVAIAGDAEKAGASLVSGPEVADLTEKLRRLLADEALRARLSAAGRQFAKAQYSLEVMGRRLAEMYEETLTR